MPSDVYQALTMARLTWLMGWTWVGAIAVGNDYGRLAIQVFLYLTSNLVYDFINSSSVYRKRNAEFNLHHKTIV
jgi:hypothetical protein